MKEMTTVKPGEKYKVKRDCITKEYGVRVHDVLHAANDKAWPGEVGTIVLREWTCHDGTKNSGLWWELPDGRSKALGYEATFGRDAEYFIKVK